MRERRGKASGELDLGGKARRDGEGLGCSCDEKRYVFFEAFGRGGGGFGFRVLLMLSREDWIS